MMTEVRTLVKSFKRLYVNNKISLADIQRRLDSGTISQEEYDYITESE